MGDEMELLERDPVLSRLAALVDAARDGRGSIALIRGEAGIGKTSVVRELARRSSGSAHVLVGACDDLVAERPLGPVWDMADDEPCLSDAAESGDAHLAYRAIRDLLARSLRPTIAIFEDVHWADDATLDLVRALGRRMDRSHGVLVLTFRERLTADHPLTAALGDLPQSEVEQVVLQPLSRDTVLALADEPDRGARVWALSKGNPFYVSQLLAAPHEEVPRSVSDVIRSLLARLSPAASQLVELTSVVPGRVELSLLNALDPSFLEAIEEAANARLLEMDGAFVAFRHDLARGAVEGSLSEPTRRDLNSRVLAACEALGFDVARSAHFAVRANDDKAIVRLVPTAAARAAAAGSHREAITYLEALAPHLDHLPDDQQAQLHEMWAREQQLVHGGGLRQALAAVDIRRESGDELQLGRSLVRASMAAWASKDPELAFELNDEAIALLEAVGGESLAEAYADRSRMAMHANHRTEARRHARRALDLSPHPSRARAAALITLGILDNFENYPAGVSKLQEASEIGLSLALEYEWHRAITNHVWAATRWDHSDVARAVNDEARARIHPETAALADFHRMMGAVIDTAAGRFEVAASTLRDVTDRGKGRELAPLQLAGVLVRMGDAEAGGALQRAWTELEAFGQQAHFIDLAVRWAEYLWAFQRRDAAATRRHLEALGQATLAIDRADLGLWLWLDGHIDAIPPDASEPIVWLSTGRWREVAAWYEERGQPYERAVALNLGDVDARLEALAIADRIDAAALAGRIRRELRSEGVRGLPRRPAAKIGPGAPGLTRRQGEVLALLAAGLTNAEIAERLFISPRTAEKHVAALLLKLGAADRRQAGAMARASGFDGRHPENG